MTRINSAIKPSQLTDSHLLSEIRELPRIFTAVMKRVGQGKGFDDIPDKFTLGTGHVKFFYDKCGFLLSRHLSLRQEYYKRFGKVYPFDSERLKGIPDNLCQPYLLTTTEERSLLVNRISTRIRESKQKPRYYGKDISKEEAVELLN